MNCVNCPSRPGTFRAVQVKDPDSAVRSCPYADVRLGDLLPPSPDLFWVGRCILETVQGPGMLARRVAFQFAATASALRDVMAAKDLPPAICVRKRRVEIDGRVGHIRSLYW